MLAPVFPGCHVFCRPATYHGIEPPPVLPSLDKRAGIEPALSLLVAGGDPGFATLDRALHLKRSRNRCGTIPDLSRITTAPPPISNPCVTQAGFRHLRARHRLTIPLRTVKSFPRFPAATRTPEARYCAQGFDVGPALLPGAGLGLPVTCPAQVQTLFLANIATGVPSGYGS